MYSANSPSFSLDNFEGPLELLLYLIQKDEIDICSIEIRNLTTQFMESLERDPEVEMSSETLSLTASLLLMKSQKLLPSDASTEEIEEDTRLELIQSLIEYCRFKEAAKILTLKEEEQRAHFPRMPAPFRKELGTGLEEIEMESLKNLLQELLKKSDLKPKQLIHDEEWRVSDKIEEIRLALTLEKKILFASFFSAVGSRLEGIVLFLALLEMMKNQLVKVVRENENLYIVAYEPGT